MEKNDNVECHRRIFDYTRLFESSITVYTSLPVHVHTIHAIHVVAMEPTPSPPHAWLEL